MFSSPRGLQMYEYLAWYYGNSRIMQSILDSQGVEISDARTALEESLKQFYVETAGDWGIALWEKELALNPPANATLELRRALVKAKLLRPQIITPKVLESIANCFVPAQNAKVIDPVAPYMFKILLPQMIPWIQEMLAAVNDSKPAHLGYGVEINIKTGYTLSAGMVSSLGGSRTIHLPPPRIAPTAQQFWGAAEFQTGMVKILPSLPRKAEIALPIGLTMAKGGYRKIMCDPADLPVHDKISAAMGWPMAILLRKAATVQVQTSRPTQAAIPQYFGAVSVSSGSIRVRAAPPKPGHQENYFGAIVARTGIYTIQIRR